MPKCDQIAAEERPKKSETTEMMKQRGENDHSFAHNSSRITSDKSSSDSVDTRPLHSLLAHPRKTSAVAVARESTKRTLWLGGMWWTKEAMPRREDRAATSSTAEQAENAAPAGSDAPFSPFIAASPHWSVPLLDALQKPSDGFSPFVAFCFAINYILGTGFLTIPWAFVQSGLALSAVLMVTSALVSDVAKDYVLETMARSEVMLDSQMHWIKKSDDKKTQKKQVAIAVPTDDAEEDSEKAQLLSSNHKPTAEYDSTNFLNRTGQRLLLAPMDQSPCGTPDQQRRLVFLAKKRRSSSTAYLVGKRKFEVNTLCRVYLGKPGLRVFTLFICLYMCGLLWAYTSVFSSAMAKALPLVEDDSSDYVCYAIIFGLIVVPLSCLELTEQVAIQVFLTGCRFVMLFLMLATSKFCADDNRSMAALPAFDGDGGEDSSRNISSLSGDSFLFFRPQGLYKTLPILVVANMYHHSIPGLSHPVAEKKQLGRIFMSTSILTATAYSILGIVLGVCFGSDIEQSSNLNWNHFHAGTGTVGDDGRIIGAARWTKLVSMYVILFPAIDVVSAFPLNAITLGNNMFGAAYGSRIHEVEKKRWLRTCFRLLASVPPVIFAMFVRELGVITDYTGTTGFVIGLSIPALLFLKSKKMAIRKRFSTMTQYTSFGSSDSFASVIFWSGIVMVITVFLSLTLFK